MERVAIGLLGLGTVGGGVAQILGEHEDRVAHRAGKRIEIARAVVRDPSRARTQWVPRDRIGTDPRAVVDDPDIGIVVEVMGGTQPALDLLKTALRNGKDVVTANKALLAEHGAELFAVAREHGRTVAFEGSVAGGIPIINALAVGLAANQVQGITAILNGTCNFILTAMSRDNLPYAVALKQAQEQGFAEADPTLDVDGSDTAHKLAVLAELAFGAGVTTAAIPREGIDRLQPADIAYATELGYSVKLLAVAKWLGQALELRVAPTLVRRGNPLAEVRGPFNAVRVIGDAVGDALFQGRGAGALPTASAVVGDLIDTVIGRAALTFRALDLWSGRVAPPRFVTTHEVRSRYYLRFTIADRPGVIAALTRVLGDHGISIASVIQHDPGDDASPAGASVPLVIMTHLAIEGDVDAAMRTIDRLDVVHAPSVRLNVEE